MKRLTCVLALLLISSRQRGATDKAKAFYKQGLAAETRLDYVAAYNLYHQAYDLKPGDLTYRASFERCAFLPRLRWFIRANCWSTAASCRRP